MMCTCLAISCRTHASAEILFFPGQYLMPPELLAVADCVTIATPAGGLQLLVHLLLPHRQNGRPIEKKIFLPFSPLKIVDTLTGAIRLVDHWLDDSASGVDEPAETKEKVREHNDSHLMEANLICNNKEEMGRAII